MTVAVDTGGTFTDCAYTEHGELRVVKVFSTPASPHEAALHGVAACAGTERAKVRHGTTVGTNTLIERKGARVALVTTAGFEDVLAIGRQARASLYDWDAKAPVPLVPGELRFGVDERVSAEGLILKPPDDAELETLRKRIAGSGAAAIAVCLLFSFANPANERRIAAALAPLRLPLSLSHLVLPEFREYERTATVAANAYLAPRVGGYLSKLSGSGLASLEIMQSSGGIATADYVGEQPIRTALSGPAGGVMGACFFARLTGLSKIITFDMGGTSTDVSTVELDNGGPIITNEGAIAGIPVSVPSLDIHTVGAGGGSLAYFHGPVLHVGPESAGANPGPICYGRGMHPTVTDANALLRRLDPSGLLGGSVPLDLGRTREHMDAARGPFPSPEAFAAAILSLVETSMEQAIRVISVERGHDPRDFTLVAFGGAGPLHACSLAKALRIPRVLIPLMPGALSATGILVSDRISEHSRTVMTSDPTTLPGLFEQLERNIEEGAVTRWVDVRYRGQGYELTVPWSNRFNDAFHQAHRKRFGFADTGRPLEIVTIRARAAVAGEQIQLREMSSRGSAGKPTAHERRKVFFDSNFVDTPVYRRESLLLADRVAGPALISEYSSTTVIPPGCTASPDKWGNLLIGVEG